MSLTLSKETAAAAIVPSDTALCEPLGDVFTAKTFAHEGSLFVAIPKHLQKKIYKYVPRDCRSLEEFTHLPKQMSVKIFSKNARELCGQQVTVTLGAVNKRDNDYFTSYQCDALVKTPTTATSVNLISCGTKLASEQQSSTLDKLLTLVTWGIGLALLALILFPKQLGL